MPPHPFHASLNHVIKSSTELLEWYIKSNDINRYETDMLLEIRHLKEVSEILNQYLLYQHDLSEDYWNRVRKKYLIHASLLQVLHHNSSWEMLAVSTNQNDSLVEVKNEYEFIINKYKNIADEYFESFLYKNAI